MLRLNLLYEEELHHCDNIQHRDNLQREPSTSTSARIFITSDRTSPDIKFTSVIAQNLEECDTRRPLVASFCPQVVKSSFHKINNATQKCVVQFCTNVTRLKYWGNMERSLEYKGWISKYLVMMFLLTFIQSADAGKTLILSGF